MQHKHIATRFWGSGAPLMQAPPPSDRLINLSIGDTDFITDTRIIDAAMQDAKQGHTKYTNPQGDPQLIAAIQAFYQKEYDMTLEKAQIFVTASSCMGMELVMFSILNPGDEVILFAPYFSPYRDQVELAYGKAVEVPTDEADGFAIREDRLRAAITEKTKAIVVNNPCNPTGAAYDMECYRMLAAVAQEHDLVVICDEIYTDYMYETPFVPLRALPDMAQRTITLNSFSKNFMMTGWRIGYVVAEPHFTRVMQTINENMVYTAPSVSQRAAIKALELHDVLKPTYVEAYRERVYYAAARCNEIPYLSALRPKGTFYLFINIQKTGLTSQQFCARVLEQAQVGMIPGNAFGQAGEGYVRIACTVGMAQLQEAFDRLAQLTFQDVDSTLTTTPAGRQIASSCAY